MQNCPAKYKHFFDTIQGHKRATRIAEFVRYHGFDATIKGGFVSFSIDYTKNGELAGSQTFEVLTMTQARVALGY